MMCTEQKDQASTADGVLWSRDRSSAGHSSGGTAAQKHPPPSGGAKLYSGHQDISTNDEVSSEGSCFPGQRLDMCKMY